MASDEKRRQAGAPQKAHLPSPLRHFRNCYKTGLPHLGGRRTLAPMITRVLLVLACSSAMTLAQQPPAELVEANQAQRAAWGMTDVQYRLVHPSRRPGGDTYNYWKARERGPHGNLLERVPGGPRRPVKV
jgi:hypothetical protein